MSKTTSGERPRVTTQAEGNNPGIGNSFVHVRFDLSRATYSVFDSATNECLLEGAGLGDSPWDTGEVKVADVSAVDDALGRGMRIELSVARPTLWRHADFRTAGRPTITRYYAFTLYDDRPAVVIGFGIGMPTYLSMRLTGATPLRAGTLFGGRSIHAPMTLNGSAGAEPTSVQPGLSRRSLNNLLLTGLVEGRRRSVVFGGLGQCDFAKVATLDNGAITLACEDPIGVLIDEEQVYRSPDTFYLDLHTTDPFESLEQYGLAMRAANDAKPNVCDFPVLCGWSVGHISKLPNINNSAKLVEELDHANRAGLTRYTPVAIRLEPDKYHLDTEQGWWDDEHFRRYGHLVAPYDTIAKWCRALEERRGVPYIYMQLGMPSDDYARAHPEHMLFNDASEVDRFHPNPQFKDSGKKHPHHQPYVTYDYTDASFSQHMVDTWTRLRRDGIRGVKIDYPESAWRPEGGFDDRYASTNRAYRRAFELIRQGMGPDGLIDERNLGESGRPCLDVTAGVIDTQRTWMDSNAFVPEMISIGGLRWYKNRTVFNYYSDTKAVHGLTEGVLHALVTMNHLTSGRLDLATSFGLFTPQITHAVSRSYPHYPEPVTARPLDAFTGVEHPRVYHLEHDTDWHLIALFNTGDARATVGTAISGEHAGNAIGLEPDDAYHAYEFWSRRYLGKLPGTSRLELTLDPMHCGMICLKRAADHPQVLSTTRHLLQGWVDLADVRWDAAAKTLSGVARVIGGETFTIVIAQNGHASPTASAKGAAVSVEPHVDAPGLICLNLTADQTADVSWSVRY